MYWKLNEAVEELKKRQKIKVLLQKVDEILGHCPIPSGPYGFLARHIAGARMEDILFQKRCRENKLCPLNLEYSGDPFFSNNPSKMRLLRLFVLEGYGRKGGPRLKRIDLVARNIDKLNKMPLSTIETKWGESLVQFHHRTREMLGLNGEIVDISSWLKSIGPASEYYRYLLTTCVVRGILFESFESPGFPDLDAFTERVVLPAWKWVNEKFDCSPLIVRHPETDSPEEEKKILNWYPSEILKAIPVELR